MRANKVGWAVAFVACLSIGKARAADSSLISFEMEDQFKQVHSDSAFRGAPVIVLVANKGGSKYSRQWSPALRDSLVAWSWTDVKVLGVAHMAGVPFFLKGMVKGKLPKEPAKWMLLDWKGKFYKAYECTKDTCNVLLFDAESRLRFRLDVGPLAPAPLDSVRALVSRIRSEAAESADAEVLPR